MGLNKMPTGGEHDELKEIVGLHVDRVDLVNVPAVPKGAFVKIKSKQKGDGMSKAATTEEAVEALLETIEGDDAKEAVRSRLSEVFDDGSDDEETSAIDEINARLDRIESLVSAQNATRESKPKKQPKDGEVEGSGDEEELVEDEEIEIEIPEEIEEIAEMSDEDFESMTDEELEAYEELIAAEQQLLEELGVSEDDVEDVESEEEETDDDEEEALAA